MRVVLFVALLPIVAIISAAQDQPATLSGVRRIHTLNLVSNDLRGADRDRIVRAFQGRTYYVDELADRVRDKLREQGYAFAEVGAPQMTCVRSAQSKCDADVRLIVRAGAQYYLGEITFTGNSIFSSNQLRAQFSLQRGALFNSSAIGKGLENLRELFGTEGYANFGAIPKPQYDMDRHIINLTIDMDQGRPVIFGKLSFEGIEPRAGAAKELLASWKELEGKRYNSHLMKEWLTRNSVNWRGSAAPQAHISPMAASDDSHSVLNMLLHFQ